MARRQWPSRDGGLSFSTARPKRLNRSGDPALPVPSPQLHLPLYASPPHKSNRAPTARRAALWPRCSRPCSVCSVRPISPRLPSLDLNLTVKRNAGTNLTRGGCVPRILGIERCRRSSRRRRRCLYSLSSSRACPPPRRRGRRPFRHRRFSTLLACTPASLSSPLPRPWWP